MVKVINRRRAFLADVAMHQSTVVLQGKLRKKEKRARVEAVLNWHHKERTRAAREQRQRINALRSENIEEYVRMARKAKNERLTTLLNRTDDIMSALGHLVQQQRERGGEGLTEDQLDSLNREVHEGGASPEHAIRSHTAVAGSEASSSVQTCAFEDGDSSSTTSSIARVPPMTTILPSTIAAA